MSGVVSGGWQLQLNSGPIHLWDAYGQQFVSFDTTVKSKYPDPYIVSNRNKQPYHDVTEIRPKHHDFQSKTTLSKPSDTMSDGASCVLIFVRFRIFRHQCSVAMLTWRVNRLPLSSPLLQLLSSQAAAVTFA